MKRLTLVLLGVLAGGVANAGPASYLELGYISGGKNGENGSGSEDGFEFAGSYAFNDRWYAGGAIGSYERPGDVDNDDININGGATWGMTERTDLITELGFWGGEQDTPGLDTDPTALEIKTGVSTAVTDQFSLFGTISLVFGDLDTPVDDDLRNFVWSAGGAYSFTPNFSVNLKIVEGSNGVNGQDDIVRIGGRWTF